MLARRMASWVPGALMGLLAFSGDALANGRTAATASALEDPRLADRLLVGTTFGLLVSTDDGASWRWTCEENIGYSGVFDPVFAVTPTGALLATTYDGLRVSRNDGCSFGVVPDLAARWTIDLSLGSDGSVWTATSANADDPSVFVSRDDAATFQSAGLGRVRSSWRSVRVAPSDPGRVFVSGYLIPENTANASVPLLYRREPDGGWTEIPFAPEGAREVMVLAIDPLDADVVFARVAAETSDQLFRSGDGGVSWTEVLTTVGAIAGMVVPAGERPGVLLTRAGAGYRSVDGVTWTPTEAATHGFCLSRRRDGSLIACGDNWANERAALLTSTDDAASFQSRLRFDTIEGPLACDVPGGIHADVCAPMWPSIAMGLGMVYDGAPDGPPADGGTGGGGGGGCGCGVAFGLVGLVGTVRRRKRPR